MGDIALNSDPPCRPREEGAGALRGVRAAEDEEAENRGSVLGDFGVWPGLEDHNQGGNGSIRKEIGPKCRTNKENFGHFFFLNHDQRF